MIPHAEVDSKQQRPHLSDSAGTQKTPLKRHRDRHSYPTPPLTNTKPTWTSSDLDAPRPKDVAITAGSRKRIPGPDDEIIYVDSESDSGARVVKKARANKSKSQSGVQSRAKREESGAGRKVGSWTREETRALWDAMFVPPSRIDWEGVSAQVPQRDKLSCSNKWRYDLLPKVQAFNDSLGD